MINKITIDFGILTLKLCSESNRTILVKIYSLFLNQNVQDDRNVDITQNKLLFLLFEEKKT